jgi:hypothetical protein
VYAACSDYVVFLFLAYVAIFVSARTIKGQSITVVETFLNTR